MIVEYRKGVAARLGVSVLFGVVLRVLDECGWGRVAFLEGDIF
jgi:hypothetical protein